jgi:hypothetical protein
VERGITLGRAAALHRYWSKNPKVDWLKAAQLGYKPPEARKSERRDLSDLARQLGVTPGRTVVE